MYNVGMVKLQRHVLMFTTITEFFFESEGFEPRAVSLSWVLRTTKHTQQRLPSSKTILDVPFNADTQFTEQQRPQTSLSSHRCVYALRTYKEHGTFLSLLIAQLRICVRVLFSLCALMSQNATTDVLSASLHMHVQVRVCTLAFPSVNLVSGTQHNCGDLRLALSLR